MTALKLTAKESAFASSVVLNGGDKLQAYKDAGYSQNMNPTTMSIQADKIYNKPKISLKIAELQKKADKVAEETFTITVEQRLRWLKDATEKGLDTYVVYGKDGRTERVESISGAVSAINTMNAMLGAGQNDDEVKPLSINIGIQDARKNA